MSPEMRDWHATINRFNIKLWIKEVGTKTFLKFIVAVEKEEVLWRVF